MAVEPGVVGHFVVSGQGGVAVGHSREHVAFDGVEAEVAQSHGHRRTHECVLQVPVDAGILVPPALSPLGPDLQKDLPRRPGSGCG